MAGSDEVIELASMWAFDFSYLKDEIKWYEKTIYLLKKEQERRKFLPLSNPDVYEWETKDGKMIPIEKLGDNHLKNILKMLERKLEKSENELYKTLLI
jgi:hypothetical protein